MEPDGDVTFNVPLVKLLIVSVDADIGTETYSFLLLALVVADLERIFIAVFSSLRRRPKG